MPFPALPDRLRKIGHVGLAIVAHPTRRGRAVRLSPFELSS
jgi:hypothetical protein